MIESFICIVVTGITCSVNESMGTITSKKTSNHYAHFITPKRVRSLLGPSPRQCTWATQQRWSLRGRPWPRGHILKSLALASKPQVLENCPVLGSRTALFFECLNYCR